MQLFETLTEEDLFFLHPIVQKKYKLITANIFISRFHVVP